MEESTKIKGTYLITIFGTKYTRKIGSESEIESIPTTVHIFQFVPQFK